MFSLKARLAEEIGPMRERVNLLRTAHGDKVISECTISQAIGGMRSVKCMVSDISALDPMEGIKFRGYSIPEIREKLPKVAGGREPLPEGLLWLLMTGKLPT
ncbi:MAG: citrate (Si)-synthase, partial [Candidatus Cloacimonetes bacterium]|nr:citrate (Si)-synthase [Candidatus Cloacimonadota bacterium]